MGKKLTNLKNKMDFFDQKNKLGLSLRRKKKDFLGKKLTNLKKKDFSDQKNKLGLSLRRKKKDFLGKKLTNLKKKWTFWTKKTS